MNHSNECLNCFLCIGPTHNAYRHLPFQSDYLLKFQFTITYTISTLKNLIYEMKMIKIFMWLMNMVQNMWNHMWNNYYKFHKGWNFIYFWVYLHFKCTITCIVLIQIYSNPPWYIFKNYFLKLKKVIIYHNMQKYCEKSFVLTWFKFKNIHSIKHYNVTS